MGLIQETIVQSGSDSGHVFDVVDWNGDAVAPTAASYSLTDETGAVVGEIEDVAIGTPAASMTIVIPASANTPAGGATRALRRLVVKATYTSDELGAGAQYSETMDYIVASDPEELGSVNEGSDCGLRLTLADTDGSAATPTAMTWRLTDADGNVVNGRSAVDVAEEDLAETTKIHLTPGDNTRTGSKGLEERNLTVTTIFDSVGLGNDTIRIDRYRYWIVDEPNVEAA